MSEDGSFSRVIDDIGEFEDSATYVRVDGTIGFRHGNGTYLLSTAEVTADGTDSQLCTTGELTWTLERVPQTRAKPSAMNLPRRGNYLKLSITNGR